MKIRMIKSSFMALALTGLSSVGVAALPPQFSECLNATTMTMLSFADLRDMAKAAKMTYCQNQATAIGATEVKELLMANADVGISLAKTSYSISDFLAMAQGGSYVLFVDSSKLNRMELTSLMQAGVQLVIMAASSGLSQADLMTMAGVKPFIYNVDAMTSRGFIQDLVNLKVHVVIRTGSTISKADAVAIAQTNSTLVTFLP